MSTLDADEPPPVRMRQSPSPVMVLCRMMAGWPAARPTERVLPSARHWSPSRIRYLPLKYEQSPTTTEFSISDVPLTLSWLPALPSAFTRRIVAEVVVAPSR